MRLPVRAILALMLVFGFAPMQAAEAGYDGPIIDSHAQFGEDVTGEEVVGIVRRAGVAKVILSSRGPASDEDIAKLAQRYPDIVIPAFRTKIEGFQGNPTRWFQHMDRQARSGLYGALQELLVFHDAKFNARGKKIAPKISLGYHDRRIEKAIAITGAAGWPLTLHYEFRALEPARKRKYMEAMEDIFRQHRDMSFVLIHMAQLDLEEVERLISDHPNVYFQTSTTSNSQRRYPEPWTFMFVEGGALGELMPAWKRLLERYPERFLIAFDGVFPRGWRKGYELQAAEWRAALGTLPAGVADLIAHKNAERLWPALRN